MNNVEKTQEAQRLLKEVGCPGAVLDALWVFELAVKADIIRLNNWVASSNGQFVEGEEIKPLLLSEKHEREA